MGRRLEGRVVLATHNAGKLDEFKALLAGTGVELTSVGELGLPVPEETGTTFEENARLKALAAVEATGLPALADDSGLCVDALGGAPGVHTADWAGEPRNFQAAMARVQEALLAADATDAGQRRGAFVALLYLAWPDGHAESFEGRAPGTLVWPPRGSGGHGYDPMFQPDGESRTFAEMTATEKSGGQWNDPHGPPPLSHRARAFAALAQACLAS